MVHLSNELIIMIMESSLAFEKGPERGQPTRLTQASVKTILKFRTVSRTFQHCSSDFFAKVLQEKPVKLIQTDLDMLEVITRNAAICRHLHTLCMSTVFPIRGLLGAQDSTDDLPPQVTAGIFEYCHLAEINWLFYPTAIERLAGIIRRLAKLKEVVIKEGSEGILPLPMPWKGQMITCIKRALMRHNQDIKGFRDVQAIYAVLKALTEAESKLQRVKIAKLPVAANGFWAFVNLGGGLPSVTSLDVSLFVAARFDPQTDHTRVDLDNDAEAVRSVFSIFPNVTDLRINSMPAGNRAYLLFKHALIDLDNRIRPLAVPANRVRPYIHNLTSLELAMHLRREHVFFSCFSALICRYAGTLRHVALYTADACSRNQLGVTHYIQPLLMESVRLDTFFLQLGHQALDARDLSLLPRPLDGFAERAFVRHLPRQYRDIPRDVIWRDWAGPGGGDGYFAGDFELWFGDAGNRGRKDVWLPAKL